MAGLDELDAQDRAVVELLLDKGQSYGEIARTLQVPEDRVRAFARHAVEQLKDSGGGEDEAPPSAATVVPVFALYLILIFAGLAYFIVIGLEHH